MKLTTPFEVEKLLWTWEWWDDLYPVNISPIFLLEGGFVICGFVVGGLAASVSVLEVIMVGKMGGLVDFW